MYRTPETLERLDKLRVELLNIYPSDLSYRDAARKMEDLAEEAGIRYPWTDPKYGANAISEFMNRGAGLNAAPTALVKLLINDLKKNQFNSVPEAKKPMEYTPQFSDEELVHGFDVLRDMVLERLTNPLPTEDKPGDELLAALNQLDEVYGDRLIETSQAIANVIIAYRNFRNG